MPIVEILQAANIVLPSVINLITIFRHKDGSATVITELDAGSQASQDIQGLVNKWKNEHPDASATTGPVTPVTPVVGA